MGPVYVIEVRYTVDGCIEESSRRIPFRIWLKLQVGSSIRIRVDPIRPTNWVPCWDEFSSTQKQTVNSDDPPHAGDAPRP